MRILGPLSLAFLLLCFPAVAQKERARSPRILNAKTVYFFNRTGSLEVGTEALIALKKWNKYQIVTDRNQADLILLLDCDPYLGGDILYSGGQTRAQFMTTGVSLRIVFPTTPRCGPLGTLIFMSSIQRTDTACGAHIGRGVDCSQASTAQAPALSGSWRSKPSLK